MAVGGMRMDGVIGAERGLWRSLCVRAGNRGGACVKRERGWGRSAKPSTPRHGVCLCEWAGLSCVRCYMTGDPYATAAATNPKNYYSGLASIMAQSGIGLGPIASAVAATDGGKYAQGMDFPTCRREQLEQEAETRKAESAMRAVKEAQAKIAARIAERISNPDKVPPRVHPRCRLSRLAWEREKPLDAPSLCFSPGRADWWAGLWRRLPKRIRRKQSRR